MKTKSTLLLTLLSAAAAALIPASGSFAQTLGTPTTLHTFIAATDGSNPEGDLVLASDGNFYGTTSAGGVNGYGTIYRITPSGAFNVIHNFVYATDGGIAAAGSLFQATDGQLYGCALEGGPLGGGTVYRIALDGTGFTVVHGFDNSLTNSPAGYYPDDLIEVGGAFYGTSFYSSNSGGYGTIFKMLPDGTVQLVHAFAGGADGERADYLTLASNGKIYGSGSVDTDVTGALFSGNIFMVDPATGTETTITTFQGAGAPSGGDFGPLVEVSNGSTSLLYGTSAEGGTNGDGTLYSVTLDGTLTIRQNFKSDVNGSAPGGLVLSADGKSLFGTTRSSASTLGSGRGGIFRYDLTSGGLTYVHLFSQQEGVNTLKRGTDGRYYGTAILNPDGTAGGTVSAVALDPVPGAASFVSSAINTTDASGSVTLTLQRTGGSDGTLSVAVITADGTAVAGTDYTGVSQTVQWTDGDKTDKTVTIPITDRDLNDGSTRSFMATISGVDVGTPATATITITETVPNVMSGAVSFASSTINTTDASGSVTLTLQRTGGSDGILSVVIVTVDGTAVAGTDYTGVSRTVQWAAGDTADKTVTIPIIDRDLNDGSTRSFTATISGASVGTPATTTIVITEMAPNTSLGAASFASSTSNTTDASGSVTLTLQRTGGSDGTLSVAVVTTDGTAVAGIDYTGISQTVQWAAGDTADKTVTVPITDRDLNDGSTRSFTATISGASVGTPATATVVITEQTVVVVVQQPTVEITSPPADLTVVSGTQVTIAVSITDPDSFLQKVNFFVNDIPYAETTDKGPFAVTATAPPIPGTYTIKAVATDNQGRTNTSTRTIVVVTASTNDPAPTATIFNALGGRNLAGGDTVSIVAEAKSLSPDGTPLASVAFYADNTLIAKYDGRGNLITQGQGAGSGRRTAAATPAVTPSSNGSLFFANWGIPNLDKLVNLITVATSAGGRSQISAPIVVNVKATNATSNHAPRTKVSNLTTGQKIKVGSPTDIIATATDPDGSSSAIPASAKGRHTKAAVAGSLIKQMDFYLNQIKVATSTTPPYTASITPPAAGAYVIQAISVDDADLSGPASPVTIQAVSTPILSLVLPGVEGNKVARLEGSGTLKVRVVRSGDTSAPLTVNYKAKGANVQGVDINQLKGTLIIPAGAASGKIKVRFLDDGVLDGNKTLKLRLIPSTDGSYDLGTPAQVKIQVIDLQGAQ